jgi:hypothetical protein
MALSLMLLLLSCDISVLEAPIPYQKIEDELRDCLPLSDNALKTLEGIYSVTDGSSILATQL